MHQINLSIRYIYLTENTGFGGLEFDGLYDTQVDIEERLSYHVYMYSRDEEVLKIVA